MNLLPVIRTRYFDHSTGAPLVGGKLYTYQAGTSTPQATYTDSTGSTPNANPVVLDANGEASVWADPTLSYKFVLQDSLGNVQWTVDNVIGLLTNNAVSTASIQNAAVTTAKLALNSVDSTILKSDASIDANRAVTTNHIQNLAVTSAKIGKTVSFQSSDYTLTGSDDTAVFDATAANRIATLPTAASISGRIYSIKKTDSSNNTVTINTTSAQTIDGRASGSIVLKFKNDYLMVQSDGSNWLILSKKEAQYLLASSSFTLSGTATNNFAAAACSVALTPGHWRLSGEFWVSQANTGASQGIRSESGFYAADGANSASTPTALSGMILGNTNFDGNIAPTGDLEVLLPSSNQNSNSASHKLMFDYCVTANTTVYLVPRLFYSTAGNSVVRQSISAIRIW